MEVIQYFQKANSSEQKTSEIFNVSKTTVNNIKKKENTNYLKETTPKIIANKKKKKHRT